MSSPTKETEEPTSSTPMEEEAPSGSCEEKPQAEEPKPPAKRPLSGAVIEISDTESDDSDICAVTSYQATADEVKRIRGADYSSSSSSSSDYSSDSESPWEDDSMLVDDEKPRTKIFKAQLNPRANRMDDPKLNPTFKKEEVKDRITTHWKECKNYSSEEITLTCEPFRLCLLNDFLENSDFVNNIIDDMNTLDWSRKKMDLYEYHQTADLASLTWQRGIKGIYELLKTEFMGWVSEVTGLELTSVSASCSLYGPGDHLLVHDDMLGSRRVAFILYLAPWRLPPRSSLGPRENGTHNHNHNEPVDVEIESCGWAPHMGGALELLGTDAEGQPTEATHKVYPRNNMLAFFKVGPETFHQVGEVLSLELPRLSINGWFHGPAPPPPPPPPADAPDEQKAPPAPAPAPLLQTVQPHSEIVILNQWLESTYMSPRNRAQIQTQMERESEVCLRDFLHPAVLEKLTAALKQPDLPWELAGPPNQRHYSILPRSWTDSQDPEHPIRGLLQLLTSTAFVKVLLDCTDLTLTKIERLELQRWKPGDYSLLPPRELYQHPRLELTLHLCVDERPLSGGSIHYVAPEDSAPDGSLVTVPPHHNALNLVFADAGAASFTKYIAHVTGSVQPFYTLVCSYRE